MQTLFHKASLLGMTLLAACSTSLPSSQPDLSGSSWTLEAYRPATGSEIRPERPEQYQLHFQPGRRLLIQIDCNRGSGSWETTDQQGGLRLGPPTLTKMMCPPAALTAQLPAAIESVASYRVTNGGLQLKSENDIYIWQRVQP